MTPLSWPRPLRHLVEETLRALIVSGALASGQHLVELEVADRQFDRAGPAALPRLHRLAEGFNASLTVRFEQ